MDTNIQTHSEKTQTPAVTLPVVIYYWVQSDCQESSGGHEHRVQPGPKDYTRLSSPPLTELLWFLHSFTRVNPLYHLVFLILERDGVWQDVTAAHTPNKREETKDRINAFFMLNVECIPNTDVLSDVIHLLLVWGHNSRAPLDQSPSDHKHKPLH